MDIEEPTPNRLSNCSSKNQVNFFRNSIKSRLSNDSLLSFPEFYDSKSEQKMSLQSNISQKIRREENSKGLFDQLLDQNEMNYNNSRGYGSNPYQFKNRGSDLESMINESQGASRMSIEEEKIQKITCKCSKSKCLLMYCECFSKGLLCNKDCSCYQCRNNENFQQKRQKARMSVLEKDPHAFTNKLEMVGGERVELANKRGCNCKKTRCFKKYCECFNAGVKCTYLCNCENCLNGGQNVFKEQM